MTIPCQKGPERPVGVRARIVQQLGRRTARKREALIAHLVDEGGYGHDVLGYGPVRHPQDCSLMELVAWHDADHAEDTDGVSASPLAHGAAL